MVKFGKLSKEVTKMGCEKCGGDESQYCSHCQPAYEEMHGKEDKRIKVLEMIADDMKKDAKHFDGQPFTGKTVAEYFGYQGAAIATLAKIIRSILEEKE